MIIVFGGAFNPPTKAHLEIIQKLKNEFRPDRIIILPVGDDYQKKGLAKFSDRKKMIELLIQDLDNVEISCLESERKYQGTLIALDVLRETYNDDIYFVMGADNLKKITSWINYQDLLAKYPLIIFNRNHLLRELSELTRYPHEFYYLDFDSNLSSTDVRNDLKGHQNDLTPLVYKYIIKKRIY